MSVTADTAYNRSRQHVAAGLIVRLGDRLARCKPGRLGVLGVTAVPVNDVAAIAQAVAEARPWAVVSVVEKTTPTECLRQLARLLDADHTGNATYLCRQLHEALGRRNETAVAVVAGTAALRPCQPTLELLAGHPRLILIIVADDSTAQTFNRRASRPLGFNFRAVLPIERERLASVILRLDRDRRGSQVIET